MADTTATIARTIRIDGDLWRRIRVLAAKEDKSANQWTHEALRLVVEKTEGRDA